MKMSGWRRWFRFNAVGAIGIVVQLAALSFLTAVCGIHYLLSTFLAVELAIVHNFLWHERWTWSDRQTTGAIRHLMRFNLTTGLVSLVGNLALMPLLVQFLRLRVLPANIIAIAICSLANFLLADRVVFSSSTNRTQAGSRYRATQRRNPHRRQDACAPRGPSTACAALTFVLLSSRDYRHGRPAGFWEKHNRARSCPGAAWPRGQQR
jgi:putative flippase GtrA